MYRTCFSIRRRQYLTVLKKFLVTNILSSRGVHDVTHKVTAVGSRSSESAQKFIKDVAGGDESIKAYGSYKEVFADEVCTPMLIHIESPLTSGGNA